MELNNKKKILIITNSSEKGGEAVFINNLASGLAEKNFNIKTISFLHKNVESAPLSAFEKTFMNPLFVFGKPVPTIADLSFLSKKISEFDIVYNFVFNIHSILFAFMALVKGKRVISTFHTNLSDGRFGIFSILKIFVKFVIVNLIFIFSYKVVFITDHQRKSFRQFCVSKGKFDKKSKVLFYYNFYPCEGRKVFLKNNRFSVLFVGRLTKEKGFDDFVKIASDSEMDEIDFHIIGEGQMIKDIPNKKNVFYHGKVNNFEVQKIMTNTDIFLFPTYNETFGLVILEAMSKGMIVLASALPEIKEKIKENIGVLFFNFGDISDMKEKIKRIMNQDRKSLIEMSNENIEFIRGNMTDINDYVQILIE